MPSPESPELPESKISDKQIRLLIAGGGTGGHLFPGVAVAEEVSARNAASLVQFVGTEKGIEARVLPKLGWDLKLIKVSGLKTVGLWGKIRGLLRIPGAIWQSRKVIKAFKPDVVLGVGGYASGPLVLAARLMGRPTAILEQNSVPGMTNKILGKLVRRIFISFDESRRFFPNSKVDFAGNPIRAQIRASLASATSASEGKSNKALRVFVFGGSQGAVAVNRVVVSAAAELAERDVAVDIVHQTGTRDLDETVRRYKEAGVDADCRAFIDDMATEYAEADIVVARAGATTIAELGVVGRPAILIPYPHAADNHQELNAKEMADADAALMFRQADLSGTVLADAIAELASDEGRRERMGSAMNALGRPEAATTIANWLEQHGTTAQR